MNDNKMESWFAEQRGCFDVHESKPGHGDRFLKKLKKQEYEENQETISLKKSKVWMFLQIAAVLAVIVSISLYSIKSEASQELADVSPEMRQTQDFFTAAIAKELYEIKELQNPQNKALIDDTVIQLELLEADYQKLKKDFITSGEDKRVIHAMIINFQTRIDLLTDVLDQIKETKHLNSQTI